MLFINTGIFFTTLPNFCLRWGDRYDQEKEEKEEDIRVPKISTWILVEFNSKNNKKHYVGQIIEMKTEKDE